MKKVLLSIDKEAVYNEVAKTTSYVGAKTNDAALYDRIFTTDEDKELLKRFWEESKNVVTQNLKRFFISEKEVNGIYTLELALHSSFKDGFISGMQQSLFSFFVMTITGKWFSITDKDSVAETAASAMLHIDDILKKVYYKQPPRIEY
ncbi:MAG: hypothetical protein MSG77_04900 [Prevotella sp.]|nr:hypothetical protein [Prevotella sp.]